MIKDCPFCGAPGDTSRHPDPMNGPTLVRAGCSKACCPSMWEKAEDETMEADDRAEATAIRRWNTRPGDDT